MTHHSGRHFLQIPGPTNVPDRILRAIDRPTIDHRGPEFAVLGKEVLEGMRAVVRTRGGTLCGVEMGLKLSRVPVRESGVAAALEYLGAVAMTSRVPVA